MIELIGSGTLAVANGSDESAIREIHDLQSRVIVVAYHVVAMGQNRHTQRVIELIRTTALTVSNRSDEAAVCGIHDLKSTAVGHDKMAVWEHGNTVWTKKLIRLPDGLHEVAVGRIHDLQSRVNVVAYHDVTIGQNRNTPRTIELIGCGSLTIADGSDEGAVGGIHNLQAMVTQVADHNVPIWENRNVHRILELICRRSPLAAASNETSLQQQASYHGVHQFGQWWKRAIQHRADDTQL